MKKIEDIMKLIAQSQELEPEDELTELIGADDELSEDEMDLVSAAGAGAPDMERFKKFMAERSGK